MTEKEFSETLMNRFKKELTGYDIACGEALLYRVIVSDEEKYYPESPATPKRGVLSFQTDVLIKKNNVPLVVVEAKFGGFSTHDVLTYSSKALKHKEIYPYLRYGLVVGEAEVIGNKFFTHNLGFDFAIAIPNTANLLNFDRVIKEQVSGAELLLNTLKNKHQTKIYASVVRSFTLPEVRSDIVYHAASHPGVSVLF